MLNSQTIEQVRQNLKEKYPTIEEVEPEVQSEETAGIYTIVWRGKNNILRVTVNGQGQILQQPVESKSNEMHG